MSDISHPETYAPVSDVVAFRTENAASSVSTAVMPQRIKYKLAYNEAATGHIPIWLISMTDLMGIVLTFFVLLFTMSTHHKVEGEDIAATPPAQGVEAGSVVGASGYAGDQDTISINKIDYNQSLNLGYLKSVLENVSRENDLLKKVTMIPDEENKRLIITLPHDLLFDKGRAEINPDGKAAITALTGVLKNIPNGIEIIGHADPTPASQDATVANWNISLARAIAVSSLMKAQGYSRSLPVMGASSGLYDQLPATLSEQRREALSRRVDLIINLHDNTFQQRFGIGPE